MTTTDQTVLEYFQAEHKDHTIQLVKKDNEIEELKQASEELKRQFLTVIQDIRPTNPLICEICLATVKSKIEGKILQHGNMPRCFSHSSDCCKMNHCEICFAAKVPMNVVLSHTSEQCRFERKTCSHCGAGEVEGTFCTHLVSNCPFEENHFRIANRLRIARPPCDNCGAGKIEGQVCYHLLEECKQIKDYYLMDPATRKGKGKGKGKRK
jgi:hypothetical protein